jgi:ketosteroid isomerase-like protein
MDVDVELLKRIYDRFNARDIDGVLTALTDDVAWALHATCMWNPDKAKAGTKP